MSCKPYQAEKSSCTIITMFFLLVLQGVPYKPFLLSVVVSELYMLTVVSMMSQKRSCANLHELPAAKMMTK